MAERHELDPEGDVLLILSCNKKGERKTGFGEGAELRVHGAVKISLPDDDAPALLNVLRVVHCRLTQVPQSLGLEELCQVAVIVDKYGFHEALRLQSEKWLNMLAQQQPITRVDANSTNFMARLVLAWVFRRAEEFDEITQLAVRNCRRPIESKAPMRAPGELLVPAEVIECVEKYRRRAIDHVLLELENTVDKLLWGHRLCSDLHHSCHCDVMLLRGLLKTLTFFRPWPRAKFPASIITFSQMSGMLRSMTLTSFCGLHEPTGDKTPSSSNCHSLISANIEKALSSAETLIGKVPLPKTDIVS